MRWRWMAIAVVGLIAFPWVRGADLSKIERKITKEPQYAKSPSYCLMVFGPNADQRRWLVLDGLEHLYVDVNGNGDLTEPGEKIKLSSKEDGYGEFERTKLPVDGGNAELRVIFFQRMGEKLLDLRIDVTYPNKYWYGAWGDHTGEFEVSKTAKDAPILHVGGPLKMGFEVQQPLRPKGNGELELSVGVGTPGHGNGSFTHLAYNVMPEAARPRAVMEFPSKLPGKPSIKVDL